MGGRNLGGVSGRRFVRVVERQGWDVELVDEDRTLNFPDREAAMRAAQEAGPEWIEVGVVVPAAGDTAQHHRWTSLRRGPGGDYQPSGLRWGGPG